MDIIDPHIHLINLEQGQYQWLNSEHPPFWANKHRLQQSFYEVDLTLQQPLTLHGFVNIEAGFDNNDPCLEIDWLEQHCQLPFKSIAYLDITSDSFERQLTKLCGYSSVIGIRDILDQQAIEKLTHPNTLKNLALIAKQNWIFEVQMDVSQSQHVACLLNAIAHLPNLTIIINHAGQPLSNVINSMWVNGLEQLKNHPRCWIKCSGWEMQQQDYDYQQIAQIIAKAIDLFGVDKVMLASNFPVSTLVLSYSQLWTAYVQILTKQLALPEHNIRKLCCDNAKKCYQL